MRTDQQTAHRVCRVEELPPGERIIVQIGANSVGVFNIDGEFFALKNLCPHQMAPLCLGRIGGTNLLSPVGEYVHGHEGEIIRCPWHRWEFNIKTGRSVFNPHRVRVKSYEVAVQSDDGQTHIIGEDEDDPAVETYSTEIKQGFVVVYA